MLEKLRLDLKKKCPHDLIDALIDSYKELKGNYYLEKHEPSELNGGKLVEAFARLLDFELNGNYTALGVSIYKMPQFLRNFENAPSTFHDSLRLHIPRALISIYNIRNRRGVGHIGGDVNANFADATLISSLADWVIMEIFRIVYTIPIDDAQKIVDQLVRRKLFLIHDINGIARVLNPNLTYKNQVLLLLAHSYPSEMSDDNLISSIEHSNKSNFRKNVLKELHKKRLINADEVWNCIILPPGLAFVESNYQDWIDKLNRR